MPNQDAIHSRCIAFTQNGPEKIQMKITLKEEFFLWILLKFFNSFSEVLCSKQKKSIMNSKYLALSKFFQRKFMMNSTIYR